MIALTTPYKTRWHDVPAGVKLAALCLFTLAVFLTNSILLLSLALGLVLGCYALGGLAFFFSGLMGLRPLWFFLVVIVGWHIFRDTLDLGLAVALRLVATVALANLVTMTTRLDDMVAVVHWLLTPIRWLGIDTRPLGLAIALVVRFTPVLAEKGSQISEAWRARSPRRPAWRILSPFALCAIDDAEQVAEALRARGGLAPDK